MPSLSEDNYKPVVFDYFKDKPCGTVANFATIFPVPMGKTLHAHSTSSYVKLQHDIYVLHAGQALVGKGGYCHVYWTQALTTEQSYVMKRQPIVTDKQHAPEHEAYILHDLGLYQDSGASVDKLHHYIVMPHTGDSLQQHVMSKSTLKGFDLAIQLCWSVHCLHEGLLSRTRTGYAHRDIKPQNFTVNTKEQVSPIDMGAASSSLDSSPPDSKKTPLYYPNDESLIDAHGAAITLRQLDVFALKRTIYMPDEILCAHGRVDSSQKTKLLSRELLDKAALLPYFDTSAVRADQELTLAPQCFHYTPLLLASLLVLGRYGLGSYAHQLLADPDTTYSVLGMYFYYQPPYTYTPSEIIAKNLEHILKEHLIKNASDVPLLALGPLVKAGLTYHLATALSRSHAFVLFPLLLIEDSSPTIQQAISLLWKHDLHDLDDLRTVGRNKTLAEQLIKCCFDEPLSAKQRRAAQELLFTYKEKERPLLPSAPVASSFSTSAKACSGSTSPLPRVALATRARFFSAQQATANERSQKLPSLPEKAVARPRWQ